ncbi:MAG TPA: Stp1/IreP family PP2C-type Ser/Thr phosphatase [Candidatus Binataceae bacterium]|nr:Stp1/IreP family PP2C-type Ser/Thr phosphatase [Candidatus Binataceae bacterium]
MITCPQCGAQNGDETKFCDRCGQGLVGSSARTAAAVALPPLTVGTVLKSGMRIVEVIGQTAHENRYRAERPAADGKVERFQLREQLGPQPEVTAESDSPNEIVLEKIVPSADEDPNGPRAKTAELKLKPAPAPASTPGDSGGLATAASEEQAEEGANAVETSVESRSAANGSVNGGSADADGAVTPAEEFKADAEVEAEAAAVGEAIFETDGATASSEAPAEPPSAPSSDQAPAPHELEDDLGEVFGRVMALSMTLNHPALQRAVEGFADNGRVYLAYRDEPVTPLTRRSGGLRMSEADAIAVAIQLCQAVSFVHRRGLRVNDICPESVVWGVDGRIKLTGLDCVSNDTELQSEPIFNDGYTAPEIYKTRKVDKHADIFSVGALLYTCLTGERLESESWREEAGPIRFYPPHVVSPALEQAVRRALLFDPAARWANVDALKAELVRLSAIIRVRAAVLTDVGMVRELNEDSIMAVEFQRDSLIEPAQNFLYVVADGMGGAEAGEMASAIAVGSMRNYVESKLQSDAPGGPPELRQLLQDALEDANRKILDYQAANIESRGMGSTGVSVLIAPPEAVVAWVGDSRAYFCDQNGLRQITKDHSLVQRLIEIGQITAEEARHHEHKYVITRSLGARQSGPAGAESISLRLKRGDRMLLCSDGLTAHVEDPAIGTILRRHSDPYEAARELVVAANAGGGTDNVSVVVIFID